MESRSLLDRVDVMASQTATRDTLAELFRSWDGGRHAVAVKRDWTVTVDFRVEHSRAEAQPAQIQAWIGSKRGSTWIMLQTTVVVPDPLMAALEGQATAETGDPRVFEWQVDLQQRIAMEVNRVAEKVVATVIAATRDAKGLI